MKALLILGVVAVILFLLMRRESFANPDTRTAPPCPAGYTRCASGDCRLKTDIYAPCS